MVVKHLLHRPRCQILLEGSGTYIPDRIPRWLQSYRYRLLFIIPIFAVFLIGGCSSPVNDLSDTVPIYQDQNQPLDARVEDLLARMTLAEKIGQMTQVDRQFLEEVDDIGYYHLGSILSGGGSTPIPNTPTTWVEMVNYFQSKALSTRLQIPLIYGIDAVHGHNNVVDAVIFPHNIGLGCTDDSVLVASAAAVTAREVAATGIHWTFSPCIAVPQNERWGRTYEGFSESPDLVKNLGAAAVRGYQGESLADETTILACAKHYVGDGGTADGVNTGDVQVDEQTLREIHLPGYAAAIEAGVGSIMASFNSWNGEKVHGDRYLLTTVLKDELGFSGFVVSDWGGIDELPGDYRSDIETAINAGIDMVMVPQRYKEFIGSLTDLVEEGSVSIDRIDDAVSRILRIKFRLGLFEHPYSEISAAALVGNSEHRAVARDCVKKSVVLLKNEGDILPLRKDLSKILVAGNNVNNIGYQCGGWTITWQGGSGYITDGTTILQAIKNTVSDQTEVIYSPHAGSTTGVDVAVVVIGETPYAETEGDSDDLSLDPVDLAVIENIRAAGIPMVVILISGRPLIITDQLPFWDALMAAWLPGTEGQGVADVLFGDYAPTGKLSYTWPRSMDQLPINIGDPDYDPLFPYGYGLTY